MRRRAPFAMVLLAVLGSFSAVAVADAPAPVNDNYLESLRLEDAHHRIPRGARLDVQDTTLATVQTDLLAPAGSGGGAEPTSCDGVNYGRTVWYDLSPDQSGAIRLQSAGRDGVIALYAYDSKSSRLGRLVRCVNEPGVQDQLDAYLEKGKSYTVQLGGVDSGAGPAGGQVQFTQQFLDDRDGDHVLDAVDKCVGTRGSSMLKGCLAEIDVTPTFAWTVRAGGVSVDELSVTDTAREGGKAVARCCGTRVPHKLRGRKTLFTKGFKGRLLPFGSTLTVTVTRPGAIAERFRWRVSSKGVGTRQSTCILPATGQPPKDGKKCQ